MEHLLTAFALGIWLGAVVVWAWWHFGGSSAEGSKGASETPAPAPVIREVPVVIEKPTFLERVVEKVLPAPPPVVVEKVTERVIERPVSRAKVEPWRVEFVSGSGRRVLGREVRQDRRQAAISYTGMDGLKGSFVQDTQKPDGTWVYRRVSVER